MRASGILMHVTSLPGPNGIGAMGKPAHRFVDFLEQAGQKYWQVLPLSPTGYGDSPYQSFSAFAGNHYLIDLELLVDEGLLRREEVEAVSWSGQEDRVDYGILYENRGPVLYKAYERFLGMPNRAFHQFIQRQQDWLQDYALFMALKEEFQGKPWQEWPDGLRLRQPEEMAAYREKLKYKIAFQYFLQFKFFEQWDRLHRYAKSKGVRIMCPWTPPTCGQTASCSSWMRTGSPGWWQGCRRMRLPPTGSYGGTLCTTGRSCARPAMPGGCAA